MIHARIAGIPCCIDVTYFHLGCAAKICADPNDSHEGEPFECEYTVCDQRGRPAPWLQRKVTESIDFEITSLILDGYYENL